MVKNPGWLRYVSLSHTLVGRWRLKDRLYQLDAKLIPHFLFISFPFIKDQYEILYLSSQVKRGDQPIFIVARLLCPERIGDSQ